VPIINENDVVSFTELKFGDNDKLSALWRRCCQRIYW
jgi:glutamate 5-kinase